MRLPDPPQAQPNDAPRRPLRRNARGLLIGGPQLHSNSDQIAKLIAAAQLSLADEHYKANIVEERRSQRIQRGRSAAARHGRRVRPWEC